MKKAIPIDIDGNPSGSIRKFSDGHWEEMIRTYGKKLRWRLIEKKEKKSEIEEQIWIDNELKEDSSIDYNNFTKRELINKYGLSEDLMKISKQEIIETIEISKQYK